MHSAPTKGRERWSWNLPVKGGLKARVSLAPGNGRSHGCGLNARAKRLVPNESLIKGYIVFGEHRPHLHLEISPLMMFSLVVDVADERGAIIQTNREHRVSLSPRKLRKLWPFAFDPFRRRDLEAFHDLRDRFCPRQKQCDVNMVGDASNAYARMFRVTQNRDQVGVQFRPDGVRQPRTPVLGTEYSVHQHTSEGLRHASEYSSHAFSADLQSANVESPWTQSFALGWGSAGLQPAIVLSTCTAAHASEHGSAGRCLVPATHCTATDPICCSKRERDKAVLDICPFQIGDVVTYQPSPKGYALEGMGERLERGARYKVEKVQTVANQTYITVAGYAHPGGGLHWTEFAPVEREN